MPSPVRERNAKVGWCFKQLRRHSRAKTDLEGEDWSMQKKIFWASFTILGLLVDMILPIWWALAATLPVGMASWWIAYRSDWF